MPKLTWVNTLGWQKSARSWNTWCFDQITKSDDKNPSEPST